MIEPAKVCMKSEKHIHEAISIYEEAVTKTTTTTTTTTPIIKESISKAYVKMCSQGSVYATTIEEAVKVLVERFEYLKFKFGCAHSETLIVFRELLLLYKKN